MPNRNVVYPRGVPPLGTGEPKPLESKRGAAPPSKPTAVAIPPNQLGGKYGPDRRLTRRQEIFVREICVNQGLVSNRECARRAGFPISSCAQRAWEMLSHDRSPHIVAAISRYNNELDEQYKVSHKHHIRALGRLRNAAAEAGQYASAIQAEYRRGQTAGIYVNKTEVRVGSIDSMTEDEVRDELKKIRRGSEDIIDVTPRRRDDDQEESSREGAEEEPQSGVGAVGAAACGDEEDGPEN